MRYLLDTCVISELIRPMPNQDVVEWIEQEDESMLFISALTFGEIEKGIQKLQDGRKKLKLQHWLEHDLHLRFKSRIINIDEEVASLWGRLSGNCQNQGKPLHVIDGLLAATAISHGMTLVTRNTKDMNSTPVMLLNPWKID